MDLKFISLLLSLLMGVLLFSYPSSETQLFQCEFVDNSSTQYSACVDPSNTDRDVAFYVFGSRDDFNNEIINAKVGITSAGGYDQALCCTIGYEANMSFEHRAGATCDESQFDFAFLSGTTNAKLSMEYNASFYNHSICLNVSGDDFASLDVIIDDSRDSSWEAVGFDCMFRFTNAFPDSYNLNAKLSSCNAQFQSAMDVLQYPFVVYARLTPNIEAAACNSDCTSPIDGRIYQACGQTIQACQNVPQACDGSLVGQWVNFGDGRDILCQRPFDSFRTRTRTDDLITVESRDGACRDIIVERFSVLIDREPVTMNIYICND